MAYRYDFFNPLIPIFPLLSLTSAVLKQLAESQADDGVPSLESIAARDAAITPIWTSDQRPTTISSASADTGSPSPGVQAPQAETEETSNAAEAVSPQTLILGRPRLC